MLSSDYEQLVPKLKEVLVLPVVAVSKRMCGLVWSGLRAGSIQATSGPAVMTYCPHFLRSLGIDSR